MEIKTRIIAYYSQTGHRDYPEDTWDAEREINNEEDLYKFIVELHKRDAHHFSDYPMGGACTLSGLEFYSEQYIVHEDSVFTNPKKIETTVPFLDNAITRYKALCARMKTTIPALRRLRTERAKMEKERAQYEKLKRKFES